MSNIALMNKDLLYSNCADTACTIELDSYLRDNYRAIVMVENSI